MNNKKIFISPLALLLLAYSGFVPVAEAAGNRPVTASIDSTMIAYDNNEQATHSECRRNRVVWSGGIARRGPDRISPRPVRSRWQRSDESRIYCAGGNPFNQQKVADQSWIR